MAKKGEAKGRRPGAWQTSSAYSLAVAILIAARKDAQMTQREVTGILGKNPSWLAKIERKERRMDLVEFISIARALGIKEGDLLRAISAQLPKKLDI